MKIDKRTRSLARKLFRSSFVHGQINEDRIRAIASAIATKKPRYYLGILKEIEKLVRSEIQKFSLHIESSMPLGETRLRDIQSKVQSRFPASRSVSYGHNPVLIGGIRIKLGSNVWDGSIAARLEKLRI